jgi:hypothetical protein
MISDPDEQQRTRHESPARVIVAMQDHPLRRALAIYLRRDGHFVTEAMTKDDLITQLCRAQCDLLVSDSTIMESIAHWEALIGDAKIIRLRSAKDDAEGLRANVVFDRPWDMDDVRAAALHLIHRSGDCTAKSPHDPDR